MSLETLLEAAEFLESKKWRTPPKARGKSMHMAKLACTASRQMSLQFWEMCSQRHVCNIRIFRPGLVMR